MPFLFRSIVSNRNFLSLYETRSKQNTVKEKVQCYDVSRREQEPLLLKKEKGSKTCTTPQIHNDQIEPSREVGSCPFLDGGGALHSTNLFS